MLVAPIGVVHVVAVELIRLYAVVVLLIVDFGFLEIVVMKEHVAHPHGEILEGLVGGSGRESPAGGLTDVVLHAVFHSGVDREFFAKVFLHGHFSPEAEVVLGENGHGQQGGGQQGKAFHAANV